MWHPNTGAYLLSCGKPAATLYLGVYMTWVACMPASRAGMTINHCKRT